MLECSHVGDKGAAPVVFGNGEEVVREGFGDILETEENRRAMGTALELGMCLHA